jgi:hypothetical protein
VSHAGRREGSQPCDDSNATYAVALVESRNLAGLRGGGIWLTRWAGGDANGLGELGLGEAALLALLGEPLAALPGHQCLAAPFGFFGTADALNVGVAVPLGVAGHWLPSSAARSFR